MLINIKKINKSLYEDLGSKTRTDDRVMFTYIRPLSLEIKRQLLESAIFQQL